MLSFCELGFFLNLPVLVLVTAPSLVLWLVGGSGGSGGAGGAGVGRSCCFLFVMVFAEELRGRDLVAEFLVLVLFAGEGVCTKGRFLLGALFEVVGVVVVVAEEDGDEA
jgi:hypothetical protein